MLKKYHASFSVILIAILSLGFSQLSSNNEIFEKVMLPCCNNGLCHDEDCTSSCGIMQGPTCQEYAATCFGCMGYISGELYGGGSCGYIGPVPTWCWDDGEKHYPPEP